MILLNISKNKLYYFFIFQKTINELYFIMFKLRTVQHKIQHKNLTIIKSNLKN